MNTLVWRREIATAASAGDVVKVVNRLFDGLDSCDLMELPPECRERRIETPQDVAYFAFALADAALADDALHLVREVSLVLGEASTRIAAIALANHRSAELQSTVVPRE